MFFLILNSTFWANIKGVSRTLPLLVDVHVVLRVAMFLFSCVYFVSCFARLLEHVHALWAQLEVRLLTRYLWAVAL